LVTVQQINCEDGNSKHVCERLSQMVLISIHISFLEVFTTA